MESSRLVMAIPAAIGFIEPRKQPRRGSTPALKTRINPLYRPKTPRTEFDIRRLEEAHIKRRLRGARRRAEVLLGGWGQEALRQLLAGA